jgi:ribonuclease HI
MIFARIFLAIFLLPMIPCVILYTTRPLFYNTKWWQAGMEWNLFDFVEARLFSIKRKRKGSTMKTVTIYTDGACSGNPGPGGWGAVLIYGAHRKELSGGAPSTTNNRMEMTAVIQALSLLKEPCAVELWSDSKYVMDGLSKGWAKSWRARDWKKADGKPALNPELWKQLLALAEIHTLRYHWVKGHAENAENNRCDQLAVAESRKYRQAGAGD